jgi:murein DD-endopeptidase MepM/ murein hydrolase activator NlpD
MACRDDRRFGVFRIGDRLPVLVAPILLLLVSAPPATAQDGAGPPVAGEPPVDSTTVPAIARRAADLAGLFRADPGGYEEVFAPDFLAQVPASALDGIFERYHAEHGAAEAAEVVGPFAGGTTIVRFRFADGSSALASLSLEPTAPHRITGALIGPAFESDSGSYEVRQVRYPRDDYEPSTTLRLPFDGTWWVFWGGRGIEQNYHRASPEQRYAYDFVIRRDGSTHAGGGKRNEDYWCEGEPVLAPAAGTIARAVDGVPENTPGEMNADQKLGNHVVIDHGDGEYSLLAHLRTGSVEVEVGDRVTAGRRVGACGNSGNSSEPHLHYQLQTGPDFFSSESLPAPFHEYVADGERVEVGEPVRGQEIAPAAGNSR